MSENSVTSNVWSAASRKIQEFSPQCWQGLEASELKENWTRMTGLKGDRIGKDRTERDRIER
jgi:hypothetical protein